MSAGMADVIAAHRVQFECMGGWEDDRTWLECSCRDLSNNDWSGDTEAEHAAHVAEELTKAGYGNVQGAKAKALREAAKDLAKIAYVVPGAAGREEYESRLAVRRGDTDKWLNSRADMIDALNDPEGHALVQAIHDRKAER